MRRHQLTAVVALVACLSVAARSQQQPATPNVPPVTFKVDIDFVEVSAVVTDAQGRFVSTLGKDDFQILEDGKPQKIAGFSLVDIPIQPNPSSSSIRAIEPDVSNNAGGLQGRLYLIVLDDLHTDLTRTGLVKAATHRFIERYLTDADLAAVVMTSGRSEGAEDFTANRRRLLGAVDTFVGQKLRSVTLEKIDTYNTQRDLGQEPDTSPKLINDAFENERGQRARNTLLTIKSLAEALSSVHGRRKAMVYIGEGIDYNTSNYEQWRELAGNARTGANIEGALRDAITAASRANVSIYSIDPRGVSNLADAGIEVSGFTNDPNVRLDSRGFLEELQLSQDSLRVLAEQTGGVASVNTNDLPAAFDRVVHENSSYYMLGYNPSNGKRDGSFRKIEVKVNRPGVQVRARRGYSAPSKNETTAGRRGPKEEGSAELADALTRPPWSTTRRC